MQTEINPETKSSKNNFSAQIERLSLQTETLESLCNSPDFSFSGKLPDSFFEEDGISDNRVECRRLINSDESASAADLINLIGTYSRLDHTISRFYDQEADSVYEPISIPELLYEAEMQFGPERIAELLDTEGGEHLKMMIADTIDEYNSIDLKEAFPTDRPRVGHANMQGVLSVLKSYAGVENEHDILINPNNIEFISELQEGLLQENSISSIYRVEEGRRPRDEEYHSADGMKDSVFASLWTAEFLSKLDGMDAASVLPYLQSASVKEFDLIPSAIENIRHFGLERLASISESTGIYGVEGYTIPQLERMEAYASDPEGFAEYLSEHDVNIAFINRSGDYNGVFVGIADIVDDSNDRTLYFEVNNIKDINRFSDSLQDHGVAASTIMFAAHSGPGRFTLADARNQDAEVLERLTVDKRSIDTHKSDLDGVDTDTHYSIAEGSLFAEVATRILKPSQGIDDPDSVKGKKRMILIACSAGVMSPVTDESNRSDGTESVIGAIGESLLGAGVSNFEVYGAPYDTRVQKTDNGMVYSRYSHEVSKNVPTHAVRIAERDGRVVRGIVSDVKISR